MFYTYLWRDASGVPFYVGKGIGKRAWTTNAKHRSTSFVEEHAKGGCSVEIVDEFILESEAHALEMELIERYGRRDIGTGVLVNRTDGGEGVSNLSAEALAKRNEAIRMTNGAPQARAKIGDASRKNWELELLPVRWTRS